MAILDGKIVSHLEDPPGSGLAACNGEPIQQYYDYQQVRKGFLFCPTCYLLFKMGPRIKGA